MIEMFFVIGMVLALWTLMLCFIQSQFDKRYKEKTPPIDYETSKGGEEKWKEEFLL